MKSVTFRSRIAVFAVIAGITGGCASEIVRSDAILSPIVASNPRTLQIAEEAVVSSSSGYQRVLPAGSIWELRGTIPQGSVYRRVNDVFTVEGAHIHEAYLVISDDRLVGYYLPVERAFSPAEPVALKTKVGEQQ